MSKQSGPRLSLADLTALGAEDRIAVMNMVKDGEVTIDEAIARVKGEALLKAGKVCHRLLLFLVCGNGMLMGLWGTVGVRSMSTDGSWFLWAPLL
jgi:hypothetical protein